MPVTTAAEAAQEAGGEAGAEAESGAGGEERPSSPRLPLTRHHRAPPLITSGHQAPSKARMASPSGASVICEGFGDEELDAVWDAAALAAPPVPIGGGFACRPPPRRMATRFVVVTRFDGPSPLAAGQSPSRPPCRAATLTHGTPRASAAGC